MPELPPLDFARGDIEAVVAASAIPAVTSAADIPGLWMVDRPPGWEGELIDLESRLARPRRARGTFTVRDQPSFLTYLARHVSPATVVFGSEEGEFTAIFDHHEKEAGPGWREHRCVLKRPQTRPWKAWKEQSGKSLTQLRFAEFLEEHLRDIASPDGADLLELAMNFTAKKDLQFASFQRLSDGQVQLEYTEEVQGGSRGTGHLEVPTAFVLLLNPFRDVDAVSIDARLRWRLNDGAVSFTFLLDEQKMDDELERIITETAAAIRAAQADVPVLLGSAG